MANTTPTNPPNPPLKSLRFAFPFRKKAEGQGKNPAEITDEHEFHKLLKKESSGSYSISSKGMWHGGIHITEGGAGQSLDIKGGVRCIADGEVVAWRMNRAYPVSELPAQGGQPAVSAPYSTGFALVRHAMEFPRGTKLTLFSLYMHLQDFAGYESEKTLPRPPYWAPEFKVTEFARDKPSASPHGRAAPVEHQGLRVRTTHPHGAPLCILPQGAQFSISERSGDWGKIKDTHGAQPYPPKAGGFVAPAAAIGGWAFLGREHGGEVVSEIMPDSAFDRVVIPPAPVKVKAGDLIGHLGRYDSLNQRTSNRMVHIEVFCGDGIKTFLQQGRAWIDEHAFKTEDWKELGLPSDPTILRVAKGTKLYHEAFNEGNDAPRTDVVLVHNFAELARRPDNPRMETTAGTDQLKLNWWKVDGANMLRNDISGWVREKNFAGGRVTREFAQSWTDFETFEDSHDPTHTMFATAKAYVDYVMGANVPEPAALSKLSPLMAKVYRAIYSTGDGSRAADELCDAAKDPWRALRMSRLIIKHESEWANPAKWQQLIEEIERQTGVKPQHEAEKRRIEKLAWWDEVKAGVSDLPRSDVFHIHPIGLVGNFSIASACHCGCCYANKFSVTHIGSQYGPVFWGTRPLERSVTLEEMVLKGDISNSERRILIAMSPNEGKLDSVQSYDSEVLTAGAMQKTMNDTGNGEFPTQVSLFRSLDESAYQELFENCGWSVEGSGGRARMWYTHPTLTKNNKITGSDLKSVIRSGCSSTTSGKSIENIPLAVIIHAITDKRYERLQLMDFLTRLRNDILPVHPNGYNYSIGDYFQSDLGRAAALDHHVNRPAYVKRDIGKSLNRFFDNHPGLSTNPADWGLYRSAYEQIIVEDYGNSRIMASVNGTSVAPARYASIKARL